MILTHVFLRGPCRWVWQWLSAAKWAALPRVTALALACGGPTTWLPAEPVPVPQRHTERGTEAIYLPPVWQSAPIPSQSPVDVPYATPSILVFLPPSPVDLRPAVAPDDLSDMRAPARYEAEDHGRDHGRSDTPRSDVPEPGTLALLLVGVAGIAAGRRGNG